jgi:D-threo-aldose 1-dehydrogenase
MILPSRPFERRGHRFDISTLGFGGAPLGNMHRILSEEEAQATVEAAWDAGLRYYDTAPYYGHGLSEIRIGAVLEQKPRDAYVLSTKVGRVLEPCAVGDEESGIYLNTPAFRVRYDYSYDGVMQSYAESLKRLGIDQIDILYVHDIGSLTHGEAADERFRELIDGGGWRALEELRSAGDVKFIGAGVNENAVCEQLLAHADPDIFLLAGRYTLLDQSAAQHLLPACADRGVGVVIGGPYNSGILATGPIAGAQYDYADAPPEILARTKKLGDICTQHGVALVEAALHFPLQHPAILSVIPGSQTVDQVTRNLATFGREPPPALWRDVSLSHPANT